MNDDLLYLYIFFVVLCKKKEKYIFVELNYEYNLRKYEINLIINNQKLLAYHPTINNFDYSRSVIYNTLTLKENLLHFLYTSLIPQLQVLNFVAFFFCSFFHFL